MKVLAIASGNVKRMLRDRSNIFFVFIFPIALILLIGLQFGDGANPAVGFHAGDDGRAAVSIASALDDHETVNLIPYSDPDRLMRAVERGQVNAGVIVPAGLDDAVADRQPVEIGFVSRPDGFGWQLQSIVTAVVSETLKPAGAAHFAVVETGVPFGEALEAADRLAGLDPGVTVTARTQGDALFPTTLGQFDIGAPQQLVLFIFITVLSGSASMILTRQLGVTTRMLSTPTPVRTIILGEGAGRFGTAILQGLYIIVATLLMFGVSWGDPLGVLAILVAFSAVGAGAAMLMGAVFSNAQQAGGVAVIASLCMAAIGGSMLPIELFPPTMQTIAHFTPHAWAISAFSELIRHDGTIVDILPQLGVLVLFAVVLISLAAWRLRVVMTRG